MCSHNPPTYWCTICLWTRNQQLAIMTAKSPSGTWHNLCHTHYLMYGGKYTHPYPCKVNPSLDLSALQIKAQEHT